MRQPVGLLTLLLFLFPASLAFADGKLDEVRKAASTPSPSSDEEEDDDHHHCCCDDSSDLLEPFAPVFGAILLSPFTIPHTLMDDDFHHEGYFVPYPYADGFPGDMWIDRLEKPGPEYADFFTDDFPLRRWTARVSVERGSDFSGLERIGGQVILDSSSRWGLHSSFNGYYEEHRHCRCDETFIGDVNVRYRFAQSEWAQMYAGLGVRFLSDRWDGEAGINFLYGGDFFPAQPVVFSWQVDGGSLGHAGVFHGRATLGVLWRRWELFGGYDYLNIGGVDLQGPMLGLRGWF
jgi:hypothetical protein